ncbi:carbohydrate ABC transporter permease [Pseudonocardia nigra]|uniref:carbohydrate ABC transporter permease n=1 Tax=Pseudonocardia nigra TaxID=1921578 RepID=UPI001C5E7197|nr:sugar ABC transporter permease [Pseudonocardia nigra]
MSVKVTNGLPAGASAADAQPGRPRRHRRQALEGWLFIAPVVLGILVFQFLPVMVSVYASFTDWSGLSEPEFIGLDNYRRMPDDPLLLETIANTFYFSAGFIPLSIGLGLGLALLCTGRIRGIAFFRTAFFVPYVVNIVAVSLIWFWFYSPSQGVINGLLSLVGVDGPAWLADSSWAMPAVIITSVWQGVGYPMIILLGGLQGIPTSLTEAATIDGASAFRRLRSVTLPLLTPHLFFLLITQFISSFQIFGIIFVMTSGGPANATTVYIYYLYQNAFAYGRMGYASALAMVLFLFIGLITAVQWRLQRRWVFYG